MRRNFKNENGFWMRQAKKQLYLSQRRRLSRLWKKTAPAAVTEEYRNKYKVRMNNGKSTTVDLVVLWIR